MVIAVGSVVYEHGSPPCSGIGLQWSREDLDDAMEGDVAAILFDDAGKAEIASIFIDVPETGFTQKRLSDALKAPIEVDDWRVGEAIAESYLVYHRSCCFPWPVGRDERKTGSSLPGADLVGFVTDDDGDRLAFGEVKTSSQTKYPPSVMYGPKGLKRQLENLRDCISIRNTLFEYLAHRSKNTSWFSRFKSASTRYLSNKSDVQLFGVLIRDVPPKAKDLRVRVQKLAKDCPVGTTIELLALYLPNGCISDLGGIVAAKRGGGARV